MANYIGQVQIENGATTLTALVGSTLYGICNTSASTAAKTVLPADARAITLDNSDTKFINNNFSTLLQGVTIHVKFIQGNTVTSNLTLQVGSTSAQAVVGSCVCDAGTIISFTLDESQHWVVNDNVDTNTEYEFMTAYNASTNKVATAADLTALNIDDAAHKDVDDSINSNNLNSTNLPTTAAVAAYVQEQTGGLSGLTGAMHFRGTVNPLPGATDTSTFNNYVSGDVVLGPNDKEYVYLKGASSSESQWIELGDESSYALKSSTDTVIGVATNGFTANTLPSLTVTPTSIPNVTSVGTAASLETDSYSIPNVTATNVPTSASVSSGVLTITMGSAMTLGTAFAVESVKTFTANTPAALGTAISVGSASDWDAGTQASLTTTSTTVVVPDNNSTP